MKNLFKIFMFIFIQFFLITCASSSIEEYDFCNSFTDDRFQFYLSDNRPIVKIKINDFVLDFLIDTGTNYNTLTNRGVQKILPFIHEDKKLEKFDTLKISGDELGSIKFSVEFNDKNSTYDGILGTPFLIQKSEVVSFDYKANEILFMPTHVVGKEEPLIPVCVQDYAPFYFMRIQIEDRNEFFVFDTGNETITLRSNYDVEKSVYPSEEVIFYLLNNDYTKTNRFKKVKLPSFSYGENIYEDIIAVYNDFIFSKAYTSGRRILSSFSSAGYPMFKDKIVQINFKNNTLTIGE